jgi:hypothetical protein
MQKYKMVTKIDGERVVMTASFSKKTSTLTVKIMPPFTAMLGNVPDAQKDMFGKDILSTIQKELKGNV